MISVLDIFKIGVGPSSSHTVGPMLIGGSFIKELADKKFSPVHIAIDLHGSLALTGKGHSTDRATVLGLAGFEPETVDIDVSASFTSGVKKIKRMKLGYFGTEIDFDWDKDITFLPDNLPLHENGMILRAYDSTGSVFSSVYYSTGGGFYCKAEDFNSHGVKVADTETLIPYPYNTADGLIAACHETGLSLSGLVLLNETALHGREYLSERLAKIWKVMRESMERGMASEGLLPGQLRVPRRAIGLKRRLKSINALSHDPMNIIDWVNMFAFAVAEENAAGGRVVTAPTNGACGIIPAVLAYYDKFVCAVTPDSYERYFMASGAIGALYKANASISGAEVGCQGEIGVACSMASAGLAELMDCSPEQACAAAEIAMEHNLGLTCDPVDGLVQVPCIERNAIMAVKAINAARMSLSRTTPPRVSLDKVIETMYETGQDMNAKYRETSQGGLAKNITCR
ncbi:L-serine ammonia-lyase [Synergistales bacterium]|nr:L-serine ammonia-lyase [Synergistales bacterium]GHS88093.1 L-serine ammonia-lyase [Synergistales bacterium]